MATWECDGEWRGHGWEASVSLRRWPNWGLGVLVHRSRFSVLGVWLTLGPFEALLDVWRSGDSCVEDDGFDDDYIETVDEALRGQERVEWGQW